ncbi:MAG: Ig-like domain-containing protein, partial [bacterium]
MKRKIIGIILGITMSFLVYAGIETRIRVKDKEGYIGEKITLDGWLEYKDGSRWKKLKDKTVKLEVDNAYVGSDVSDDSWGANWDYKDYVINVPVGEHTIKGRFEGDGTYNASEGTGKLKVNKKDSVINDFEVKEKGKEVASLGTSTLLGTSTILAYLTILPGTQIT